MLIYPHLNIIIIVLAVLESDVWGIWYEMVFISSFNPPTRLSTYSSIPHLYNSIFTSRRCRKQQSIALRCMWRDHMNIILCGICGRAIEFNDFNFVINVACALFFFSIPRVVFFSTVNINLFFSQQQ